MSAEAEYTGFQTGEIERAFAEKLTNRGAAAFATRRKKSGERFAVSLAAKGTGSRLLASVRFRRGDAFAGRIQSRGGAYFAARILERCPSFESGGFHGTPLVHKKQPVSHAGGDNVRQMLLQLQATWKHSILSEQKRLVFQNALVQGIAERLARYDRPVKVWRGQLPVEKELTVFRNIAAIFVNRGSRPDLAKKAERDLVRVLSREFYESVPSGKTKETTSYHKKNVQEEFVTTRHTVAALEEQVRQQKTLLAELTRKAETAVKAPEWDVGKLTGEVMKRMEREMHVERLRRGL